MVTPGFAISALYWSLLGAVLMTDRQWSSLSTCTNFIFSATVVAFAVAVWWPVAQHAVIYIRDMAEFWSLYRALPAQGWSASERKSLWQESLRSWCRSPQLAAYWVRIAEADHRIDRTHYERKRGW